MAYQTLLAVCTTGSLLLLPGCAALGLLSGAASMDAQPGNPRSGSPQPLPGILTDPGHSIFQVVAWSFAVIAGALALAFVARLLNGRTPTLPGIAGPGKRIPETAATAAFPAPPSSSSGFPDPAAIATTKTPTES